MSNVAYIMEQDRLGALAVVLESGAGATSAIRQALAAQEYATASTAVFLFRKQGSATIYSYSATVTLVASTTLTLSLSWAGTEEPVLSTGSGRWDFWARVTLASGKTVTAPNDGTAFQLRVADRIAAT